ncbi:MAG: V-type ATPase subunit [Candidatus Micrarchaeia archaeon]
MQVSVYERAKEYGYINARLRAARPLFLSKETLNTLCEVETVEGMVEVLAGTVYGPYIERFSAEHSGFMLVSKSVMHRFSEKIEQISRMVQDEQKRKLLYAATGRIEVYNLKVLFLEVMGKLRDGDYVEGGTFSGKRLELLRNVKDVELLKRIVANYGYMIDKGSVEYSEIAEDIEKSYYAMLEQLKKMCFDESEVRGYIESIIDYKNFDLVIRKGKDARLLPGGKIDHKEILRALRNGQEGLLKLFGLEELYEQCNGSLSWLEEMYDREILKNAIREGSIKPFSMIGVIGFIRRLDVERRNIRSIAVAKGVLTSEEIKKRIIW